MKLSETMWFTWPNALSVSRVFLALGIAYSAGSDHNAALCLWLILIACVTDVLDGALARYWGQQSGLGCMVDPVCDAFFLVVVYAALVFHGLMPLAFFLLVMGRYFLLMLVHAHLYFRGHHRLGALWSGKACAFSCVFLMVTIFVEKAFPAWVSPTLLPNVYGVVQIVLAVSFVDYLWRYVTLLRTQNMLTDE
jgi:cardiolipin synthase